MPPVRGSWEQVSRDTEDLDCSDPAYSVPAAAPFFTESLALLTPQPSLAPNSHSSIHLPIRYFTSLLP